MSAAFLTKIQRTRDFASERRPILRTMLAPRSIALIDASEKPGSVGRALLENLRSFRGHVFPINSSRATVLGQKAFRKIEAAPEQVDLAVIATPAATVPGIVGECAADCHTGGSQK